MAKFRKNNISPKYEIPKKAYISPPTTRFIYKISILELLASRTMSKTSSGSSTSSNTTKQDDVPLHHLGKYMLPTVYRSGTTKSDFTKTDIGLLTIIFSFLHFNEYERLVLRTFCHLFRAVLAGPTGMYTTFPHPKHTSLNSLTTRLNEMARDGKNVQMVQYDSFDHL